MAIIFIMDRRTSFLAIPAFFSYLTSVALGQDNSTYIRDIGAYVSSFNSNWNEKPRISIPTTEQTIHILTNQERYNESRRTGKNIPQLEWDADLANIARGHSRDMSENNFTGHVNKRGMNPKARADAYGYNHKKVIEKRRKRKDGNVVITIITRSGIGENIHSTPTYRYCDILPVSTNGKVSKRYHFDWKNQDSIASEAVEGWMNSPGHRKNILNPGYSKEGIGAFLSYEKNRVLVTQNFW